MMRRIGLATGESVIGLLLVGLGAYVLASASRMPMGVASLPGPGVLPGAIGLLLVVAGGLLVVTSRRARKNADGATVELGHANVLIGIGCLALAAIVFERAGAPAVFAVMLTVLFRFFARASWWLAILSGVAGSAITWFLFVRLLEVQLPFGLEWL